MQYTDKDRGVLRSQITDMIQMCLPEEYQTKKNPGNVIPSRLLRNLLRAMNLYMTEPECGDLLTILDPHSLGSFNV
jgi:hypothetical protein